MFNHTWFREYPIGVPRTVEIGGITSVVAMMEDAYRCFGSANAYRLGDRCLSYSALDKHSAALGAFLQSRGLSKGDRVAVMLPNLLPYPIAVAAILRAGFIAVNVNPMYTPRELEHQLRDSGASALIAFAPIVAGMGPVLTSMLDDLRISTVVVASGAELLSDEAQSQAVNADERLVPFEAALSAGRQCAWAPATPESEDIAVLQYTGGTTGVSKGASLSHRALVANVLASEAWMRPGLSRRRITGQTNIVCALPLYHVFAFVTCSLLGLRVGAQVLLVPDPRDLDKTVALLRPHKLHVFPAVNTLFNSLAAHPAFGMLDFSELCVSNGGGAAVMPAVAQRWLELTGCPIVEGYGMSETASGVTCNRTDSLRFTGTIGLPLPGVEIRIRDEHGKDVANGEAGEIVIRGPQLMSGYWNRPDETAQAMTTDGYLKSGDVGVMDDDGYIRIVDRKKDIVLVNGFNVYPSEVEAVVCEHPKVAECAVVGVPDERSGEAVSLYVVAREPDLTVSSLAEFCVQNLTGYKRPKHITLCKSLPKSPVGKVLRRELRAQATSSSC